jgi:hypothetical protein
MYELLPQYPEVHSVIVDSPERLIRNYSDYQRLHALGLHLLIAHGASDTHPGNRSALLPDGKRVIVQEPREAEVIKRCFELLSKQTRNKRKKNQT